eukprot:Skav200971  [mRNA]  locus=scaffold448:642386:647441:- [translate_table: standard]
MTAHHFKTSSAVPGAIPPMAEMQAMWWCRLLENQVQDGNPLDSACYKLTDSRLCYVRSGYYMFALAKEIGAAPSLRHWLWHNWRIMLTCAFGQAHVPIFRLQGPFRSAACQEATCSSELYNVLWTRPLVMNLTFLIEAIAFGVINGVAVLLESGRGRVLATMGLGGR